MEKRMQDLIDTVFLVKSLHHTQKSSKIPGKIFNLLKFNSIKLLVFTTQWGFSEINFILPMVTYNPGNTFLIYFNGFSNLSS